MEVKQLKRALDDLAEEGVTQVFRRAIGGDNGSWAWSTSCNSTC